MKYSNTQAKIAAPSANSRPRNIAGESGKGQTLEGSRNRLLGAKTDDLVGRGIGQQRPQELIVQGMAGAVRAIGGDQRPTEQVKVANGIEYLVLGEFVAAAQAVGVEHAVFVHHDCVLEAAA